MNSTIADSPLLQQLQQRLTTLAGAKGNNDVPALIAALYHAQQNAGGVLSVAAAEQHLSTTLSDLHRAYPQLIGNADDNTPLVRFSGFIAFRRIYQQLRCVADELKRRQSFSPPSADALQRIAWQTDFPLSDEQRLAAFSAAALPFCLITGGAGTGKTTTLSKALELILLDKPDSDIFLAAPTGKAAQRLNESLALQQHSINQSVRPQLAQLDAKTLHRLLAISEHSGRARHHADNPLCCDVLAIDEASMIGSDLLAQTLLALPPQAKLILLGDANQLPPIHSVAFFNEISQVSPSYEPDFATAVQQALGITLNANSIDNHTPLPNAVCRLSVAQRFQQQSLIARCATATLNHDSAALIQALGKQRHDMPAAKTLYQQLQHSYPDTRQTLVHNLPQRMILCAKRHGDYGSQAINTWLDKHFRRIIAGQSAATWYEGRQILIEKNHPDLQLSNGDIGRCVWAESAWHIDFGEQRLLQISHLPPDYSLAFAITIHKSQGSEYEHVDLLLDAFDPQQTSTLISQTLIYTGITRAKQSLTLFADAALLQQTLSHPERVMDSPLLALLHQQP